MIRAISDHFSLATTVYNALKLGKVDLFMDTLCELGSYIPRDTPKQ